MRRLPFAVYNLGPTSEAVTNRRARFELKALANNEPRRLRRRPKVIAGLECVGRDLPRLDHYHPPIHDQSTPERGNLALYVLDRLHLGRREWVQHEETWPRVQHPGFHEPRATLIQEVEDWTVVVSHAPQAPLRFFPEGLRNALGDARNEWLDIVAGILRQPGPVLLLTDPNGLGDNLVRRVGGSVVTGGTPIEAVHGRGVVIDQAQKVPSINGVRLLSDHHGALIGKARRR